jgi:putative ATP-dependent endonuclease of the OLD family
MRLSRIIIKNFRNFKSLDVRLGDHAVVLGVGECYGENRVVRDSRAAIILPCSTDSSLKTFVADLSGRS